MPLQPKPSQVHINSAISNVAVRFSNEAYIADLVAPTVEVDKESDNYFIYDKAAWFRDEAADNRAPGARAPRSGYTLSEDLYTVKRKSHATPVIDRVANNSDDPLRPFEDASSFVADKVLMRKELHVSGAIFTTGVWDTDLTLSGTDQWSDFTGSDPASDISTAKDTILQNTGRMPNILVIGHEVLSKLKLHPDGLDRIKHTQKGVLTLDLIAQWLDVDRIIVGSAIRNTQPEGLTESMSFIWGKNALLAYVTNGASVRDPNAAYTFQLRGGFQTKTYREEAEEQDVVEASIYMDTKVTASASGYFFSNVIA